MKNMAGLWLLIEKEEKKKTFTHTESSAMNASQKNNYLKAQICIFLEYSWPHLGWWSPWWPWRCLQWGRCPHWLRRPSQTWRLGLHLQREFWFWVNLHVDTLWPHQGIHYRFSQFTNFPPPLELKKCNLSLVHPARCLSLTPVFLASG